MSAFDFTQGALPAGVTVARASTKYVCSAAGALVALANNTLQTDYDPASHTPLGIPVEPAATNLLLQSSANDQAPWATAAGSTATADQIAAPDGTVTADLVKTWNGTGNQFRTQSPNLAVATYVYSMWSKSKEYTRWALDVIANGTFPFASFDLAAGAVSSVGAAISSAGIQSFSNGWYRLWIVYANTVAGARQSTTGPSNTSNQIAFTGDGISGAYCWGHQIELLPANGLNIPSSYIPTAAATVTRPADVVTLNWGSKGIADGNYFVRYTFDDNTYQDVNTAVAGGNATIPTNLARPWVKSAEITLTLSVTATTATTATFAMINAGGAASVDLQLSPRPNFGFSVSPIYNIPPVGPFTINGLNQRATYYGRARTRAADGTVGDWSTTFAFHTADGAAQVTTPAAVMITPAIIVRPQPVVQWYPQAVTSGYPASNMAIDGPVAYMAPQGAGNSNYIDVVLSGAPIDTIALLNTNIPEAAVVTIYSATTLGGLASGVGRTTLVNAQAFRASANVPGRMGYHGLFQFALTASPYWRIVISGTALPASTLYIEHAIYGRNRATKNYSVDKSEQPVPRGSLDRTRSGVPDRVDGLVMRKIQFDLSVLTEAQYETMLSDLVYYENEAMLIVPNSKSGAFLHDRIAYGELISSQITNPTSSRFTRTIGINSLI